MQRGARETRSLNPRSHSLEPGVAALIYGCVRRLYGQCVVYNNLRSHCHLSQAHREDAAIKTLCFTPLSAIIYPRRFPLYQTTRLMQTFNMLFTHKKTSYFCEEGKINGPPLPSAPLYLSLTIWIANRTIYHESWSFVLC